MGIEKQAFKRKLDNLKITNNQQQNARILQDIENVEDFEMDEDFANELDNDELSTDEETDHENSVTDTDPLKVFFSSDENSDLEYGFFSEDDHNNDEDDEGDTDEDDDGDGNDEDDEEEDDDDEEEEDNDDSDEEEDNDSDDDDYFYYNHDDDYDDTSEEEEEDEDSFNNTKNEESIDDSVDDEEKKEKDKDSNNGKEKKLTNNDINESKSKSKMKKIKTKLSPKGKNKLENNSNKLQKVQTKGNINSTKSSKLEKRSKKLEENKNNMKSQTDKVKVLNKTQSVKNVVSKNKTQSVKNVVSKNKTQSVKNVVSNNKSQSFKKVVSSNKTQAVKDAVSNNKTQSVKNVVSNNKTSDEEYENDSSDEEDIRNTVGNIPMKWYDEYDHIGYNWEGKKIMKPEKGDQLDNFLKRMEDPDFWRTIKDPQTGQDVILSEEDIQLITRIQKQRIPDVQFDEYAPWVEWFTSEVMKTPLRNYPEHKRSFLPSKLEAKKVSKFVHALKMGWMKSTAEMEKEKQQKNKTPEFYMLWQSDDQAEEMRRIHKHIPPPKRHLPGHAESYNPPPEYLFDSKELKEWNKLKATPWKRKLHFIPQKYTSLREVPAYPRYIKERFKRCLDLYLCPRALKMRLTIEPEALVPQLPSPKDLQPFPTTMSMIFKGHTDMVRSITVEPYGQYIASGGDDMTLKIWEIATGRCTKTVACGGVIRSVAWCPNQALSLIAVAADKKVLLINPGVGDHLITKKTDQLLEIIPQSDIIVSERVKSAVQWEQPEGESWNKGIRLILNHFKTVKQVTWHGKGDYFAVVMPDGQNRSVLINQLSKRRSQLPFTKSKGLIQCVLFHPIRPFLFVATQRNVRIYDLVKQEMVKKLLSNSQWISTMAIHPGGDNILVGTYDRKMLWFDLDLSTKPYQTLRLHGTGVRGVAFHKRYPLFASGADDRSLIISHGMVYNDLLQNPLIVPLKRLCNHESYNDFGIFDVMFHPTQPWVFSAGADSTIRMYT